MEFTILGRTQLRVDGQWVDLGTAKPRTLLALLLLNVGKPVFVGMIVDQLWPGRPRDEVRGNLQSQVSRLRTALKRAGVPHQLRHDLDAYRLDLDSQLVDYHRFRREVEAGQAAARDGNHELAVGLLRDAIGRWQGDPLAELRTDWAMQRRAQMEISDLIPALYSLIDSELELRNYVDVLDRVGSLMDDHPLDETFAKQRIRALDGLSRITDATNFYAQFRQRVLNELGVEPGSELREAHRQILLRRALIDDRPESVSISAGPAANRPPPPSQLPRLVHNLTGRNDLLATLDTLLLDHRPSQPASVVALHGMPGVGKTTVAVAWAHRHRDRFPDGQLFLDLNGYGQGSPITAEDAMAIFLNSLDVPRDQIPITSDQRRAKLSRMLANRRMIIILDNARGSKHARPLISTAGSRCAVLVTSRVRISGLAIRDGVRTVAVRPLSIQDSTAWLRCELGEARVEQDSTSFETLVGLSVGLPLALTIIGQHAAHRAHTDLAELARELGSHDLVSATAETDDETATLSGVFSWSYDALSPAVGRLFRLLGLHPGRSFSIYVAAALVGRDLFEAQRNLGILSTGHLLEPDGTYRYRFHDLLHDYAADRAAVDETAEQRQAALLRIADWYLRTAANAVRRLAPQSEPIPLTTTDTGVIPLTFSTDEEALQWCDLERSNLISITHRAADHGLHDYAWRIPAIVGDVFERSGYRDDFLEALRVAVDSARAANNGEGEVTLLNFIGGSFLFRHDQHRALTHFQTALAIAEKIGHADGRAASRHNLGSVYLQLGDIQSAIQLYREALELDRKMGAADGEAYSLHQIASAYRRLGAHDVALAHYDHALRIRRDIGHLRGQGDTLTHLAALHYERGDYEQARDYCFQALDIHERSHDKVKTIEALVTLASVHYETQSFRQAVDHARRAVTLCDQTQDKRALTDARRVLGNALEAIGDRVAAEELRQRAASTSDSGG